MIRLKSEREIALMRVSAGLVAKTFEYIEPFVKPGVTTKQIDDKVEKFIVDNGGYPAFKGLYGFPASACISVDEEVVHGIPLGNRVLEEGQIVSVDIGVRIDGYYGDAAYTFPVGKVDEDKLHLMRVTWKSLHNGLAKARVGNNLQDISAAIQQHAETNGYFVVRELVGHGIGKKLHEDPQVPNYGTPGKGVALKSGMTLAVEPMINTGTIKVETLADKWTVVTADRRPSAHYEHTVLIQDGEPEILTQHPLSP
ncbi:MAG: type I methionyl aminopeptidase [Calditrichota bacterium]